MAYRREAAGGQEARLYLAGIVLAGAILGQPFERPGVGSPRETPLSTFIHPSDWGIDSPAAVSDGRVSLIHDPEGTRLAVYRLRDTPRTEPSGRGESRVPEFRGNDLIVSDFDSGVRNALGGFFNAFEKAPSTSRVGLTDTPDGRRGLHLSYSRHERGFSGVWIHFFDLARPTGERVFLDARELSTLSFWVRGERGGEQVLLKLADDEWERLGDALPLGELGRFLGSGRVEQDWQQVVVPLEDLPDRVDRSRLASLVLEGIAPDRGDVVVTRLALSRHPDRLPALPDPAPDLSTGDAGPTATWVWNTAELLDQPDRLESTVRFLATLGLDAAFVQLVSAPGSQLRAGEIDPDPRLRALVRAFGARGIRVYALDGSKEYALPERHEAVLATIRNVVRYNDVATATERFHGVRYDIEPYLLPGFHGPRQAEILNGYLEILEAGAALAREGGLRYGADIPFWYDTPDETTFERVTATWNGIRKPVSEHVIDLVDDVAIMAYRTTAYGADGVIRHAEDELRYATERGKRVFVALETGWLPDETLIDFGGAPEKGTMTDRPEVESVGFAESGDSLAVVWAPAVPANKPASTPDANANPAEWLGDTPVWWHPVVRRVSVPGNKLSFATLGAESLGRAMDETARELSGLDSFAGFAIHYSESYAQLIHDD